MLNRRQFAAMTLAAGAAPLAFTRRTLGARREETHFNWSTLGKNVHLCDGGGGNAICVPGEGGAILVDTKNPGLADTLRREAEARTRAITHVINTHHHGDHTGGNYAFADTELVSHASAVPRIEAQGERYLSGLRSTVRQGATDELKREAERRLVELDDGGLTWSPGVTIDRAESSVTAGGRTIDVVHVGAGHTDNDLILVLGDENLMHFGDLIFNGLHPFCDQRAGVTIKGWIASLQRGMELADDKTIVVPGHGPVTGRVGIRAQIDYFEWLLEHVSEQIESGKTRDEITEMTFPFMEGLGFERIRPIAIGVAYDEITSGA